MRCPHDNNETTEVTEARELKPTTNDKLQTTNKLQ